MAYNEVGSTNDVNSLYKIIDYLRSTDFCYWQMWEAARFLISHLISMLKDSLRLLRNLIMRQIFWNHRLWCRTLYLPKPRQNYWKLSKNIWKKKQKEPCLAGVQKKSTKEKAVPADRLLAKKIAAGICVDGIKEFVTKGNKNSANSK